LIRVRLQFSSVVFDADARTLTRSGEPLHLSPKAFDLLALLLDARPRVVRKEELIDALWPDVVVEEANVRNLVAEIRMVIGDVTKPHLIRTLPRIGYAFCGEVRELGAPTGCRLCGPDRDFALSAGENFLGRADDCDVPVRASGVSRKHARIRVATDGAVLEDLKSKNGTWLNGVRVAEAVPLHDADQISLGAAVFTFRTVAPGGTTTTVAPITDCH
jgi:DNA-binding winged helix-turn-helix (wHTH) protein